MAACLALVLHTEEVNPLVIKCIELFSDIGVRLFSEQSWLPRSAATLRCKSKLLSVLVFSFMILLLSVAPPGPPGLEAAQPVLKFSRLSETGIFPFQIRTKKRGPHSKLYHTNDFYRGEEQNMRKSKVNCQYILDCMGLTLASNKKTARMSGLRRRPDSNRRSGFCRPLPYHLATSPHNLQESTRKRSYQDCSALSNRAGRSYPLSGCLEKRYYTGRTRKWLPQMK